MCGLTGIFTRAAHPGHDHISAAMTDALEHRGPDDRGLWSDPAAGVWLGHRRLSIIDLSPLGHQPMASASGRLVTVFNGEIYNHRELRAELSGQGASFRGHSDTEVLLCAIERWGLTAALQKSRGMFALAVWDRAEQSLHLARDRFGEKPLFVGTAGRDLLFASELKSFMAHPDFEAEISEQSVAAFVGYGYIPEPASIFERVVKLMPGHVLSLSPRDLPVSMSAQWVAARSSSYWSLAQTVAASRSELHAPEECTARLEANLIAAVKEQMVADVPVGAFLSGGIDSSLITALMQSQAAGRVRSFTIGFAEAAYDESANAEAVARHLGTDHTTMMVTAKDVMALIPELPTIYDEPFADSSQLPTVLLSRLARRHVTVALSGDAGDESFGGYNRHQFAPRAWARVRGLPRPLRMAMARALFAPGVTAWEAVFKFFNALLPGLPQHRLPVEKLFKLASIMPSLDPADMYHRLVFADGATAILGGGKARERAAAAVSSRSQQWPQGLEIAEAMMYCDTLGYLTGDILTKVDRAAMSTSLETRIPLLDVRVVEQAWHVPIEAKIGPGGGKLILRKLLEKYVPPQLTERPKSGFGVPIDEWLRGPLKEWADQLLSRSALTALPSLDVPTVERMWREHLSRRRNWHHLLWSVLMLQLWLQRWKVQMRR